LIGSGSDLAHVKGGNKLIVEGLIGKVKPTLKQNSQVTVIERTSADTYKLTYQTDSNLHSEEFNAVILAAPLGEISLIGVETPPKPQYVRVFVTLVIGVVKPSYFGLTNHDDIPTYIVVSKNSQSPWTVFSTHTTVKDGAKLYKFFSPNSLENELNKMFESIEEKFEKAIDAYPYMPPNVTLAPIKLGPNFYYPSAFDTVIACMEGSVLSAKNSARLLAKSWTQAPKPQTITKQKPEL